MAQCVAGAGTGQGIAVSRAIESQGVGGVGFLQATGQPQQQGRAIERRGRGQGGQRARPSSVRGSRPQRRRGGQQRPEAHRPVRHRQRRRVATERSQGSGQGDIAAVRIAALEFGEHGAATLAATQEGGQGGGGRADGVLGSHHGTGCGWPMIVTHPARMDA